MITCQHLYLDCLNQYELIRKYRCRTCSEVMMCACDELRGRRYLSHQLSHGNEYGKRIRVPVSLGFRHRTCSECRGLPAVAAPKAAMPGATTKIKRFYWRELFFAAQGALWEWRQQHPDASQEAIAEAVAASEAWALEGIKALHAAAPKYNFSTESEADFLDRLSVMVESVDVARLGGGLVRLPRGGDGSPEEFAVEWYQLQGFDVLVTESRPFHVLFGAFMWLLIEDPEDPRGKMVSFGERNTFEDTGASNAQVWLMLPEDFGSAEYARRRAGAISSHLDTLQKTRDEMLWAFDYSLEGSARLRQYLWAHSEEAVMATRRMLTILSPNDVRSILDYLVGGYWERYVGWPDLLLWRSDCFTFVEVKLGRDKLSDEQRNWIKGNQSRFGFPFRVLKLHRKTP